MTSPAAPEPYGSARDLPSVQKMEQQMAAFRAIRFLLKPAQRAELSRLEAEHRRITGVVDGFYALLGERNWVFTGDMNLPAMEQVIDTTDPAEAERRLVAYYQEEDRIRFPLGRLHHFEAMRPRTSLLRLAQKDYEEGRYYSVVLVLLTVMDGFVNDLDPAERQGLHTRNAGEMVAWDSVVGHHFGLSHAQSSFTRSFRKTDDTEVTELYRHGILHGTLPNYDNAIVASKAWNRLFAIADWADARVKQAAPPEQEPTLRDSLVKLAEVRDRQAQLDAWTPHDCDPADAECDIVVALQDFLARWQARQWGLVGGRFMDFGKGRRSVGAQAELAKDLYSAFPLTGWQITRVRHTAAAVALADVVLTINGIEQVAELRWVRLDTEGHSAAEWETGAWTLAPYGPAMFLKPRD